jgi:hypothetical protein
MGCVSSRWGRESDPRNRRRSNGTSKENTAPVETERRTVERQKAEFGAGTGEQIRGRGSCC